MKLKVWTISRRLLFLLVAALVFSTLGPAQASLETPGEEGPAPGHGLAHRIQPGGQDLQLIIELDEPSIIQGLAGPGARAVTPSTSIGRVRLDLSSSAAVQLKNRVALAQQQVRQRLLALDRVQVQGAVDLALDAVFARVPADQYSAVVRLPGVRKVHFSRLFKMTLDSAATVVNASAAWNVAGGHDNAGRNVKIGIIDSGIDIDNPMFVDNTLTPPSGYPKGETNFTTSKVIVARNYLQYLPNRQLVNTAVDEQGHGSFVAGCAAGKRASAPLATISGMAPGAFLGSYKVFGTPNINDFATTEAIVAALNDAIADGMDIVNLSLGGVNWVPSAEDPEVTAVNSTLAAGVVVTISAGNDGPGTHSIGSPGTAPGAITVGSVSNGRIFASQLHVTAPAPVPANLNNIAYINGTGPAIPSNIAAATVVDVASLDGDGLGCSASAYPSGSLSGKIAFVLRGSPLSGGTCYFLDKVTNAATAGARAVIIYNNMAGAPPIAMGNLASTNIPAVMISNLDGIALKNFLTANPSTTQVAIDNSNSLLPTAVTPAVLSDFSSRGPGSDFDVKPDLVAVGEDVYSAAENNNSSGELYDSSQFTSASGTSFSAPIVAGAAAVVKQLHPSYSPQAVKSALVNTASRNLTSDGTNPADVLQAGAGLLDIGNAAITGALFSPTSLSFGVSSYSGSISLTKTLTISNASSAADQFTIAVQPIDSGTGFQISRTNTGPIPPGGNATVDLTINANSPRSGAFQGFLKIQSSGTGSSYVVPYWGGVYILDASRILAVTKAPATGSGYSSLAAAVGAARPGNVIEIADSETYDGGLLVYTSNEGLPLHGLTIRAAAGATPVISASSTDSFNLQVVNLQNVLLRGLKFSGGQTGLLFTETSNSTPLTATVDHCVVSGNSGGAAPSAIEVDGATVNITKSTINGTTGEGILTSNGAQLSVFGTTISISGNAAIDADSTDLQILNSTMSGGVDPRAYLVSCSGTLEGNTFSNSIGTFGDGIEVTDGVLTIRNNTFDSNARAGIGLFAGTGSGPLAVITGNTLSSNRYGALLNPAQNVRMESNLVRDNGRGIRCTGTTTGVLSNNIVIRSNSSFPVLSNEVSPLGDGIQIAGSANVRMANNTVYRSTRRGITLGGSAQTSAFNSIVTGNQQGDLEGLQASDVQYSLIGDGTQTSNHNITGDPRFANPGDDDYSLLSGSPALDAGSNAAAALPFLDFNRRFRVASTGARIGDGVVDMGAIEAGSTFPLIFPLLANGTQATLGDDFTTGIAVLNSGATPVQATFTAFSPDGGLLLAGTNPTSQTFGPGAQLPILGFQLFHYGDTASQIGSVLAGSEQRVAGFFLIFDRQFRRFADGAEVSDTTSTNLVFMRHLFDASGKATYAVFNPGTNPANISATLFSPAGTPIGNPKAALLAPKGQALINFTDVTSADGYVRVQSDQPISGLELFGNNEALSALRAASAGSNGRLFFPHFALNQGFATFIGVVNPTSSPADLILTAYQGDGTQIGRPVTLALAAGAQLLQPASSLFGIGPGSLTTGYITAQSDVGGIVGFTSFQYDDGRVRSAAAVPAISVPQPTLLFSHIAHQVPAGSGGTYQTGIALLNPFGVAINYTMKVFDGSGALLAQKTDSLRPGEKVAKILSHQVAGAGFFTQPLPLGSGHVEVSTDYALLGFELFFTEDFSQLASVPAQVP